MAFSSVNIPSIVGVYFSHLLPLDKSTLLVPSTASIAFEHKSPASIALIERLN